MQKWKKKMLMDEYERRLHAQPNECIRRNEECCLCENRCQNDKIVASTFFSRVVSNMNETRTL